ncbi:MAG: hypothetical protein AAB425_09400, partial [Bdellovibrionota bacterium]
MYSIAEVLDWIDRSAGGARLVNSDVLKSNPRFSGGLTGARVGRMAELAGARAGDLAFFFSRDFEKDVLAARPTLLVTAEPFVAALIAAKVPALDESAIVSARDPYLAMAVLSGKFARLLAGEVGPAEVAPDAQVAPGVYVGPGARIGAGAVVHPGCYVGALAVVGDQCELFPGVTIYDRVRIGNRARIHAGARIGADGFGYAPRKDAGGEVIAHEKIHHLGTVVIGDDVEIGANTCVDRGTLGDTVIEKMAKIDNLVQVGHNA